MSLMEQLGVYLELIHSNLKFV